MSSPFKPPQPISGLDSLSNFTAISGPQHSIDFSVQINPYTIILKDGETTATVYPISELSQVPTALQEFLCDEFNMEVEKGDTFPFYDVLHIETFRNYWFSSFAGVMIIGQASSLSENEEERQWEKECLGAFSIKPNYPGRSSHVCTANFLVNAGIRDKGIGKTLVECFLDWSPRLGYTSCVFNLIFETNIRMRHILDYFNFKRIGKIRNACFLKDFDKPADAFIYGRDLIQNIDNSNSGDMRFDKIKFYLESGRYPPLADRQEKSRLRSSAAHYRLENGILMLKNREVVSDPNRQLQIATEYHLLTHAGINKTTMALTERYHWNRIKDTVAEAIRNCQECRETTTKNSSSSKNSHVTSSNIDKRQSQNIYHNNLDLHSYSENSVNSHPIKQDDSMGDVASHLQQHVSNSDEVEIPVDPEVFERRIRVQEEGNEGDVESVEIARALMQANENDGHYDH